MTPPGFRTSLWYGVAGAAFGSAVMLVAGVPAAQALVLALVVPALVPLGLAATSPGRRGAWVGTAGAMVLGAVFFLFVVLTVITAVAYAISDPA